MLLSNKVALITGAAKGIGKQTAILFAKQQAQLILTDIDQQHLNDIAKEIEKITPNLLIIKHDVSSEQDWINVIQHSSSHFKSIDILFNNAGIYIISPLTETTFEQWNRLMNINVTGTFLGMKHVSPLMMKEKRGSIINSSSIAGLRGAAGHALYGASKGAVRIMSKDAAIELAPYNIRVNSIHPGYIKTDMADYAAQRSNLSLDELGQRFPLGRLGKADDVAQSVLFLASDHSSYITGCELAIDGGITSGMM